MEENNNYPKDAGIYKLICNINNKIYIGKANNLHRRLNSHRNTEKYDTTNCCYPIRHAIKKYGWDNFTVEILEIFYNFDKNKDLNILLEKESFYIKNSRSNDPIIGYNVCAFSVDRTGVKMSEETRRKISAALTGKKMSKEAVEKMRKAKTGVPHKGHSPESLEKIRISKFGKKRPEFSEEWKRNIGRGHEGMIMSEEAKRKISEAHKGKPKSAEHVEKMRQNSTGKKASDVTKRRMSESQKGRKLSEDHKQKIIKFNTGRKMSPEAIEKMRHAQRGNCNASGKRSEEVKQKMRESRLAYLQKQKEQQKYAKNLI